MAQEKVAFQGLPSRICWLGYGERARFGKMINEWLHQVNSLHQSSLEEII